MEARRISMAAQSPGSQPSDAGAIEALQRHMSKQPEADIDSVRSEEPDYRQGALWLLRRDCLARVLERRHITGIAFSGTVGAGLVLFMSEVIGIASSPGAILAYLLTGIIISGVMRSLAELTSVRPIPGALLDFPRTYVDPALGFAVGVGYCVAQCISMAVLTSAATRQANNFSPTLDLPLSTKCWINFGFWVLTLASNVAGVRTYGRIERLVKIFKFLLILALCGLEIAIKAGAGGNDSPQPVHQTDLSFVPAFLPAGGNATAAVGDGLPVGIPGSGGVFLSMWTAITVAFFPCMGGEMCVVAAGEARRPRRDIPAATQFMYLAPIGLYVVCALLVGLNLNYNEIGLWHPWLASTGPSDSFSPFILTLKYTSFDQALRAFLNACFMVTAYTAGNTALFVSSRTLYSLARDYGGRRMRETLGRTSDNHTPLAAILACSVFGFLTFLNVQSAGDDGFNQPLLTLSAFFTSTLGIVYVSLCIAFIRFKKALDRHEQLGTYSRDSAEYKARYYRAYWQPAWAWIGLIGCSLVILFQGWPALYIMAARQNLATGHLLKSNVLLGADLIGDYSGIILFLAVYVFYKLRHGTRLQRFEDCRNSFFLPEFDEDKALEGPPPRKNWWYWVKEVWSFVW